MILIKTFQLFCIYCKSRYIYIYIYSFSRLFYPKRLTIEEYNKQYIR